MARPKVHDASLRARLLDRAGELFSEGGPEALSLRKLATDAGTSTTAVYSLFGGKPGLLRALYIEALDRFITHLRAGGVTDDPTEDLLHLGLAYRRSAIDDPHLYAIVFADSIPGFQPDKEAREHASAALDLLRDTIRRCVEEKLFVEQPIDRLALATWALIHGLVSLELSGNLPDEFTSPEIYESTLRGVVNSLRVRTD